MFIDASALVAMRSDEDDARSLAARMQFAANRITSPAAAWECAVDVARILEISLPAATSAVRDFLVLMEIELVQMPPQAAFLALEAYDRFGKNRHPANLNFGDCFAYACARHYGVPLLYKGNDFTKTDIAAG
ncbi:ribonuclease VapC [Phyllobacterium sp. YR620]|uniref:type II toxin-antitoxin system VapC family toxin n=1 Tax=Phyllobacterium sp. YR620 TaxID=1881066 RepID=UPI00088EDAD0|nr:type II toxin-antitoxin system VapC family toxin [Phyllobacterium sp. YR620]SDP68301.1 ribonuclease VapC [Phyllobacterium sp. YR620]